MNATRKQIELVDILLNRLADLKHAQKIAAYDRIKKQTAAIRNKPAKCFYESNNLV